MKLEEFTQHNDIMRDNDLLYLTLLILAFLAALAVLVTFFKSIIWPRYSRWYHRRVRRRREEFVREHEDIYTFLQTTALTRVQTTNGDNNEGTRNVPVNAMAQQPQPPSYTELFRERADAVQQTDSSMTTFGRGFSMSYANNGNPNHSRKRSSSLPGLM